MIFARTGRFGQARVVSCAADIVTPQNLIDEARELWISETHGRAQNGAISANWGCVALLRNPDPRRIAITAPFVTAWSNHVANNNHYSNFTHIGCEPGPVVTPDGMLAIPWPKQTDGNDLKLDLLLATANYPFPSGARDPGVFPTADAIAKAWLAHPTFINYFYANRINGIYTAQDPAINRILSKKANL